MERKERWWKRWFISPILKQLTQGISAEKLAWTIAAGFALGIIPILGTTTIVCFLAALYFQLNHPVIQCVCHALWLVHLALIIPFIRLGQWILGAPLIASSMSSMMKAFIQDPILFGQTYWLAAVQGLFAWFLVSIPLVLIVRAIALPILRGAEERIQNRRGEAV